MSGPGPGPGAGLLRCRLCFDYPPPAASCRMCWLLVDLNTCRVVADVESVIRERFGFSRATTLRLFIRDAYLPHTESVHVLRDDDCVSVKVDSLVQVNGHSRDKPSKRKAAPEEEEPGGDGVRVEKKKKKKRKTSEQSIDEQALHNDRQKKEKKKKRKKTHPPASRKPAASPKALPGPVSSSEEEEEEDAPNTPSTKPSAPPKPSAHKPSAHKPSAPPKPSAHKPSAPPKPSAHKPSQTRPSSSETDSSDEEATVFISKPSSSKPSTPKSSTSKPSTPKPAQTCPSSSETSSSSSSSAEVNSRALTSTWGSRLLPPPSSLQSSDGADRPCKSSQGKDSDSEEEIQLVIRRPLQPPGWLGRGRGTPRKQRSRGGGEGSRGRGFESTVNRAKLPSYESDSLSNVSLVLQQQGVDRAPQQDYSSMPLLAAPPQGGQRIAFKLLELSDNYTPEVSEYKEGKILGFDPTTNQIELELLTASQAPSGPGKFDLVYQNADGSERVEYAVSRGSRVTERWESLLEPRLII